MKYPFVYKFELRISEYGIEQGKPILITRETGSPFIPVVLMHIEYFKEYRFQEDRSFSKLQFHIERLKAIGTDWYAQLNSHIIKLYELSDPYQQLNWLNTLNNLKLIKTIPKFEGNHLKNSFLSKYNEQKK